MQDQYSDTASLTITNWKILEPCMYVCMYVHVCTYVVFEYVCTYVCMCNTILLCCIVTIGPPMHMIDVWWTSWLTQPQLRGVNLKSSVFSIYYLLCYRSTCIRIRGATDINSGAFLITFYLMKLIRKSILFL